MNNIIININCFFTKYLNRFFYFYYLLNYFFFLKNLCFNLFHGDWFFNYCWNFNYLFFNSWYFNKFLFNLIINLSNFNRSINNLLNFYIFRLNNNCILGTLYRHHFRNFNTSFHYLLDYLLNLNDLRNHSEDFKNIINTDNSHDFLIDHTNNSFIDFKNYSCFNSNLFKLFKESFHKYSQMEFNSSSFS